MGGLYLFEVFDTDGESGHVNWIGSAPPPTFVEVGDLAPKEAFQKNEYFVSILVKCIFSQFSRTDIFTSIFALFQYFLLVCKIVEQFSYFYFTYILLLLVFYVIKLRISLCFLTFADILSFLFLFINQLAIAVFIICESVFQIDQIYQVDTNRFLTIKRIKSSICESVFEY